MINKSIAVSAALFTLASALSGCAGAPTPAASGSVTIGVNAPFQKLPWVAKFSLQGAQLAAEEINHQGGVKVAGKYYTVKIAQYDSDLSAATAQANVRQAIADHAVALIDDGFTVASTAETANAAGLPLLVDFDGTAGLIDAKGRPNVFRIAPPNDALAAKLAGYLTPKNLKIAIAHDDSDYGRDGDNQLRTALTAKGVTVAADVEVPSNSTQFAPYALELSRSGATAIIAWAQAPTLAALVKAVRAGGSTAAIYSGPSAEDPVVRTQLADHPDWVEGLTYAGFRITSESGPTSWETFRAAYEKKFGDYKAGVKTSKSKDVVQPPDWQMFAYDEVKLVAAALSHAGTLSTAGGAIVKALNEVQVKAANGDNRGFKVDDHEGVPDDDIYFATFHDMKFAPVQDDALSRSLPPIDQE